jgi:dihydropteroate synthase
MPLRLGSSEFGEDALLVMAIVNRTPDSFYDRGATWALDAAVAAADRAVTDGADIVDVGGVKAAPGAPVSPGQETERVVGLVERVRQRHPGVVISVDTWRAGVARAAIDAGADLVNDAWGGVDLDIAAVAADSDAGLVCTHVGGLTPRTRPHRIGYADVLADVCAVTTGLADDALRRGVRPDGILVDPGHDFGKNTRHSLQITRRLPELVATGWPVLVSLSNKDFVGETLDLPVGERLAGTLAATAVCAWLGARVFRAHNVAQTRQALDMVTAMRGDRPPAVARRGLA